MYDVISRSISLRYSLQLAANGMKQGSDSHHGKMQCLEMLANHETAWRTLSWSESAPVNLLVGWREPVSVSGNVICFRSKLDGPREELLLLRVPSKLRSVTMKHWRFQLPHDVQDVCIDSGQDLLIYQCGYVTSLCIASLLSPLRCFRVKSFHVCSLLTGESHPLAQHVGVFSATNSWRYRVGSLRICGDTFALASDQGLYISAWNWKSGQHISDFVCSLSKTKPRNFSLTASQMASLHLSVFTFLDENHILFPSSNDDGLYLYDIRAMPPINTRKQKLKGTHCFETSMPQSLGHETVCDINLTCNSLTTGADAAVGPFYTDYDDRMVLLRIAVRSNVIGTRSNWRHHEMHVRARSLLTWTQMHPAPPNTCVIVPWSAWAPAAARLAVSESLMDDSDVLHMCPSQSMFPGCGMRITSSPSVRNDSTFVVTVRDYHPARVFHGRRQNTVCHTDILPTEVEAEIGNRAMITNTERRKQRVQDDAYPRQRSKSLPLPMVSALFVPLTYYQRRSQLSISARPTFIQYQRWR
jgi:hypothetical protein